MLMVNLMLREDALRPDKALFVSESLVFMCLQASRRIAQLLVLAVRLRRDPPEPPLFASDPPV